MKINKKHEKSREILSIKMKFQAISKPSQKHVAGRGLPMPALHQCDLCYVSCYVAPCHLEKMVNCNSGLL